MSPTGRAFPTFAAGELLAERFRIVRFLGAGAVGEVYEAEDEALGGRVAIKALRPELAADSDAAARLHREVHLTRAVTHPNVCRTYDGFVDAAGRPFLTMELLDGEPLDAHLERCGRLPPAEACEVLRQIADGLAAAHAAGVVHRDLKTGNVFLVGEGEDRRVVVTDFGLAHSALAGSGSISRTGELVGSPAYMAPEQVRGEPVGPATDVYALGIVAYELVTGELPFRGESGFVTAIKRLTDPPPTPRLLAPELPPVWDEAVLRCLAQDPAGRLADPRELPRRLAVACQGPVKTATPPEESRGERRRAWAALAAGLALVGGSGAAWTTWQGGEPEHGLDGGRRDGDPVATVPATRALSVEPADGAAAGAAEEVRETVAGASADAPAAPGGSSAVPPGANAVPAAPDLAAAEPLHRLPADHGVRRQLEEAVVLARRGGRRDEAARALLDLSTVSRREGDVDQAERAVRTAIQLYRQAGDPLRAAASEGSLAALLFEGGRLAAAAESLDRALAAAVAAGDEPAESALRLSLAATLHALGRPGAREHLARAADLCGRTGSRALLALSVVEAVRWRLDAGELATARAELLPAIAELEAIGGNAELAEASAVLADLHRLEGDTTAARAAAERSLALAREGELPAAAARALLRLARLALDEGLAAEAVALARSAVADFARLGQLDDARRTGLVLTRAFLASGDSAAAGRELAASGAADSEAVRVRWQAALAAARLAALDGDPAAAAELARLEAEAVAAGWSVLGLDAALARAELLAATGDVDAAGGAGRRVAAAAAERRLGLYIRLAAAGLDRL